MEEDIKVLEEFIKSIRSDLEEDSPDNWKLAQAIENLIKGYKELEEENEELHKEINERIKLKIENEKIVDKDYIPKSKLQEIIEDIDNNQPVIAELKLRKLVEGDTNETKM